MAVGLDDVLLALLGQRTGDALLGGLRESQTQKAMRTVVNEAVETAVTRLAGHLDHGEAEHLRDVLRIREVWLDTPVPVSSRVVWEAALRTWITALDQPEFGEAGYLTRLGVDPQRLAETLTSQIITGIGRNARAGGALKHLAEWLWRDDLEGKLQDRFDEIQRSVARLQPAEPPEPAGSGLPGGVPDFTGRQQQLALLTERVRKHDPAGVAVAIHAVDGMAGVGKTELALQAAHQHKQRYPDGQYFIDLHGYTEGIPPVDPAAGLEELLRQAGLTAPQIPTDLASRQARWRALMAGRRVLVLLDNARDAEQVRPLLPGSASCLVLVTSRARLAELPGVRALPLDILPAAEAARLFCRIAGDTGANPDPEAVAAVVEIVGRLPVAVRAVAAQVGADYSVAELATDLAGAKQQLVLAGAAGPLGTAVATAFDTSLQRLDAHDQQAYRILGIHPGPTIGVPQFAALAGLPLPQAATTLRRLAASNLLTPVEEKIGHRRWQQHDLLREHSRHHASGSLTSEQQVSALAQLTAWYASALAVLEHMLHHTGNTDVPVVEGLRLDRPDQAWQWLAAEQDNLLAYARQASGGAAAGLCLRYAHRFNHLDHSKTAQALYAAAADISQEIGNRDAHAEALLGLGDIARLRGDYPAARDHLLAAADISQEIGNRNGQAFALIGLGHVAQGSGDYPAARNHFQAAADINQEIGHPAGLADALTGLGQLAAALGKYPAARNHLQAAADIRRATDDKLGQASALIGLGQVAGALGDYPAARNHFQAAADISQEIGNRNGQARALTGLGKVAAALEDYPAARNHFQAAADINQEIGHPAGHADALTSLGQLAGALGDYPAARSHFQAAADISQEIGDRVGHADALAGLGQLAWVLRDDLAARNHFQAAADIFQEIGHPAGHADALAGIGDVAEAEGRKDEARARWQEAQAIVPLGSPRAERLRRKLQGDD